MKKMLGLMIILLSLVKPASADMNDAISIIVGASTDYIHDGMSLSPNNIINYGSIDYIASDVFEIHLDVVSIVNTFDYGAADFVYYWNLTDEFKIGYGIRFNTGIAMNDGSTSRFLKLNQSFGNWILLDIELEKTDDYYVNSASATMLHVGGRVNFNKGVYVYANIGTVYIDEIYSVYYGSGVGYDFINGFGIDVGIETSILTQQQVIDQNIHASITYSFD